MADVPSNMNEILARIEKKLDSFTCSISTAENDIKHLIKESDRHDEELKKVQNRLPAWATITSSVMYSLLTFIIGVLIAMLHGANL